MENAVDNPEIMSIKKRYATYDTLQVANIIIVESNDDETDGDKEGKRNKFLDIVRGFGRDFLQTSTPPGTIYHGRTSKEVPTKKIKDISSQYVSAFCAPNNCLESVHRCTKYKHGEDKDDVSQMPIVEGIHSWEGNEDFAYGMATSLYESLPTGQYAGDPVADSLAIVTRDNCAILALADGVSWGQKSKLASNCSVYGSITYICKNIDTCSNTKDVFRCILKAFENAQTCIVDVDATLTTLCVAVIVQLHEKDKWCLCVVNVGDSYAYIYNKTYGVKEVTHGSHPIDEARDMRYSGGALGPADGYNPDLANLTCSLVTLDEGDIVFLCSDGISDNFDPAVAKFLPRFKIAELTSLDNTTDDFMFVSNPTSSSSSKNTYQTDDNKHRHQSLGNITEDTNTKDHQMNVDPPILHECDDETSSPSNVIYFQYDKSKNDNVLESSVVHNSQKDFNSTNTTVPYSIERLNGGNPSNQDNSYNTKTDCSNQGNIYNMKTDSNNEDHHTKTDDSTFSTNNMKLESTSVVPNAINISDKDVDNIKEKMCSEGVPLTPRERHEGALEQMKEVINTVEFEPINEGSNIRAVDICAQMMNFVINRTAEKRDILERHPTTPLNELTSEERKIWNQNIRKKLKEVPGKLDHASIVAYEVGVHSKGSLKLDVAKSSPVVASLQQQKTNASYTKVGDVVTMGHDGRTGRTPPRHITNHGKEAFSHFI